MEENILPHLKNSLPKDIEKYHVSYYTVALEAWRRGLRVTFHNSKRGSLSTSYAYQYSIADENNKYHFICGRGSNTKKKAIDITQNKSEAYTYFQKEGVPTPQGSVFKFESTPIDEIIDYGDSIGYPVVVKPTSMGGGKGVYTQINNIDQLKDSVLKLKDEIKSKDIMVEKYFSGIDYRFFVMGDKVLGVTKSYSSYVLGDGEHNIEKLIEFMNEKIKHNAAHAARIIKIDNDLLTYLEEQKLSLSSIPEMNKRIFVRRHGTHLGLRLNVDCTDEIDSKFKVHAVKAIKSVDGIPYGSVDMIINEEGNEGVVNEINTKGVIAMHYYPLEGTPRDIPKAIIDYYFPNTKRLSNKLYFEMKPIKDLFLAGLAEEVVIPTITKQKLYQQQFTITGRNLKSIYLKKIYRKAALNHLIGTIHRTKVNQVDLHVHGTELQLSKYSNFLKNSGNRRMIVNNIKSSSLTEDDGFHNISLDLKDLYNKESLINLKNPN